MRKDYLNYSSLMFMTDCFSFAWLKMMVHFKWLKSLVFHAKMRILLVRSSGRLFLGRHNLFLLFLTKLEPEPLLIFHHSILIMCFNYCFLIVVYKFISVLDNEIWLICRFVYKARRKTKIIFLNMVVEEEE